MTLTEFLLARIAKDEAYANSVWPDLDRVDGARLQAECEAKRRIVEKFNADPWCLDGGYVYTDFALRALAAVYDGHPDYRDEWKP